MSELNKKTTVTLSVNGQEAEQTLQRLRSNALQLETAIAKAAAAGNKADLRKLRKELTDTKRQIREIESATQQVSHVLRNLDKATPRELNKTLASLNKQLDYIERGTPAWDAHCAKIKMVKAELMSINSQIRDTESVWTRMNRVLNDWQTSIMGAAAAVTGLVMAGRAAVNAYAEMDEELADTRKYTGLTADKVAELNEKFKHMDTRTARAQLNELAQEAGRLGKNTIEDVQGYVEAADIINVALVDLGKGATQTIAKLSNIFGIEKDMSTRDAMLSVGSAVNVLSQNCTASKQYLVEFTQRMAGVGAQANLTIPQLLAFGATLDANGQKTEMSASALGKLTMMLFQNTSEVAAQVGLDLEKFTKTLRASTNEGLLMFLDRIRELGSKDGLAVLAPLFKDLGMDGVRMSQVLSTLAEHLDMVKWEQEEANKAFKEASSASHEYEIFNNTVQAGLDKAKKRISELSVELGEKLLPVMRHVYSSTSLMIRALNIAVDFIKENWTEIRTATVLLAAYTIGVNAHTIATKASAAATALWSAVTGSATSLTKAYTTALVLSKDAVVGCSLAQGRLYKLMLSQNIITKLLTATTLLMRSAYYACTLQFGAMGTTLKSLYVVMAANPYGVILTAIAALGTALYNVIQKKKEYAKQVEEERRQQREQMKEYDLMDAKIKALTKIINDNNRSLDDRKSALLALKKIVPDYQADLTTEGELINNNTVALSAYLAKLKESILARANQEKLEKLYLKQKELEDDEKSKYGNYSKILQQNALQGYDKNSATAKINDWWNGIVGNENTEAGAYKLWQEAQKKLESVKSQIQKLESSFKVDDIVAPTSPTNEATQSSYSTPQSVPDKDRFKMENDWRTQEQAKNRIAYAKGEQDYLYYSRRMLDIEVEYNQMKLKHTDLTDTERLQFQADFYEAQKKITEHNLKLTVEEEQSSYKKQLSDLQQYYVDGLISTKSYQELSEQLEMDHLSSLAKLYDEGTKERLQVESQLQEKLVANQTRHLKEFEDAKKKHQDQLSKVKDEFFGDNEQERVSKFNADLALLDEVYRAEINAASSNAEEKLRIEEAYQKARLALMKKYNIKGTEENKNFMQEWNDSIMKFLESELGESIIASTDTLVSGMAAIFQQLSSIVESEMEIQTAKISSRYDAEITLAEGNNAKVRRIEAKKNQEIAKEKNEANRKMFAMQVFQAIASTSMAAINAYSSAAAIPYVGYILAPIAAGMAIAAGSIQVAAIKKQQQASMAQGYSKGGFTKDGAVDEVAGVVHAGEWVASQSLTKNPKTRPLIEALDYAQRTNSIGSLSAEDVSRQITAPSILAQHASNPVPQTIVVEQKPAPEPTQPASDPELKNVLSTLKKRLDEPFITVNSVTGDTGMKQAQDEYDRLIRNKTPKSRRS